ncbi:MAG: AAA family ATPase [Armatimonadetes bacterium]|nr:AAA family ATPase [Armatimonadota bacterium]
MPEKDGAWHQRLPVLEADLDPVRADSHLDELRRALALQEALRPALGHRLVDETKALLERQLAQLLGQGTRPASPPPLERRRVTVVFADLAGFTAMSEKLDPEQVRARISACFDRLVGVIHRYGGTVEKFIGDAIVAMFGAPVAHENDPERACRAALDLLAELRTFNRDTGLDLGLHVGINTGLVIAGEIQVRGERQYAVTGDPVNLAARLEGRAERGQILVGPEAYRLSRGLFSYRRLGPLRVKGKAQPVEVYELGELRSAEPVAQLIPLVGRDAEIQAGIARIREVCQGRGGLLAVVGEAGLGKSRLAAELRRRSADQELDWLEGSTLSFTRSISYWPFLDMLKRRFALGEEEGKEAWDQLEQALDGLAEAEEILPYLGVLLGLPAPERFRQKLEFLDAEALRRQIFRSVRRLVDGLSQARPVVLLVEDLHWADESSVELLDHLLDLTREKPVLMILLCRPRMAPPVERLLARAAEFGDCFKEVHLEPLSQQALMEMVKHLLQGGEAAGTVVEIIGARAAGNPFFVEELVRSLMDEGALRPDPGTGRWEIQGRVEDLAIPGTLQGVIMARVDRLKAELKRTLRAAAVIGYSFTQRLLEALAGRPDLDPPLEELQGQQLLQLRQRDPEPEFVFRHALAREIVYESISLEERRVLHRKLAQCAEALYAERLSEIFGLLAYHYAEGQDWEKAQHYLFRLGDDAGRLAADSEALGHYRQAIEAYERAFGDQWQPEKRASLERKIGEALFRRGDLLLARRHLERARSLLGLSRLDSAWKVRTAIAWRLGRQLLRPFVSGRKLRLDPSLVQERFRLNLAMGWVEYALDQERFLLLTLEDLELAESSGHRAELAIACVGMGLACDVVRLPGPAERYHWRAVEAASAVDNPQALYLAHLGMGLHRGMQGDLQGSLSWYRLSKDWAWKAGDAHGWATAAIEEATLLYVVGRLGEALEGCQAVLQVGREAGDDQAVGWGLQGSGQVRLVTGSLEQARAELAQALEVLQKVHDLHTLPKVRAHLAELYLERREPELAREQVLQGLRLLQEQQARTPLAGWLWNARARLTLEQAERAQGRERRDLLGRARGECRQAAAEALSSIGCRAEALRLRGRLEWLCGRSARGRRWWDRSLEEAQSSGARLDEGRTYLERGRYPGDAGALDRAAEIFRACGAVRLCPG